MSALLNVNPIFWVQGWDDRVKPKGLHMLDNHPITELCLYTLNTNLAGGDDMHVNPRGRQSSEFEALVYRVSSRTARETQSQVNE